MSISTRVPRLILLTLALLISATGLAFADVLTFTANLSGANEVPGNLSPATGVATMILDTGGSLMVPVHLEFSGLTGDQVGVHIHTAPVGQNGGVRFPLPMGSPMDTSVLFDVADIANLAGELFYINVHSTVFAGGEIRGQFLLSNAVSDDPSNWGAVKALFR